MRLLPAARLFFFILYRLAFKLRLIQRVINALLRQQLAQTTVPAVSEDDIPEMDVDADMTENDEE